MKIVAISACPTGIAHTYMAAEGLEKAAKELGHEIKVETQGSGEPENKLTEKDIQEADLVLIAAAKTVDLSRFNNKKLLEISIEKTVRDAKGVLEEAINKPSIPIFRIEEKKKDTHEKGGLYKHLMSGVYTMMPFTIAGGIIIAISFMFGITASDASSADYNVIAGALSSIGGGAAFGLMVPMLAAGISYSIAGKNGIVSGAVAGMLASSIGAGFLGGLVGGLFAGYLTKILSDKIKLPKSINSMKDLIVVPVLSVAITGLLMIFVIGEPVKFIMDSMANFLNNLGTTNGILFGAIAGIMMAADMGGPINKTVATFSVGLMASGVNGPIAACMAAGMTPPLGIALATIIFKHRFTEEERAAGKTCWVLGLSYITEGAIPFAVSDPARVIPSLMAGSAVAGAISMAAGCTSLAPHGGIWIAPIPNVINNLPMYIVAIVAGMLVTCFCVGFLKRKNNYA